LILALIAAIARLEASAGNTTDRTFVTSASEGGTLKGCGAIPACFDESRRTEV
jgi:hypothetical protein